MLVKIYRWRLRSGNSAPKMFLPKTGVWNGSGGNQKRYAFGVRLTLWLWLTQPRSAGRNTLSGNDKAVSLRGSIARGDCLSGNRLRERTPSTRTKQELKLALFFSWPFSRIKVLAHRATSMFTPLQLSWHNLKNVDEIYVTRHDAERSGDPSGTSGDHFPGCQCSQISIHCTYIQFFEPDDENARDTA